jgi:outer membrane protein assembly factor BamB
MMKSPTAAAAGIVILHAVLQGSPLEAGVESALLERANRHPEVSPELALEEPQTTQLLFSVTGPDNAECVRAIADVTGDQIDEIVVGFGVSGEENVFCYDGASSGTGTPVWKIETTSGASGGSAWGDQSIVPISDPDGNGAQNVLLGTAWGGRSAYNLDGLDGATVWLFDTYLEPDSGWVYSLAELNDITGDGVAECAFGAGGDNNSVYLVDGASTFNRSQATVLWKYVTADAVTSVRAIGDVNSDGLHDVLAAINGSNADELICLDGGSSSVNGHRLWRYAAGDTVYAAGVLTDVTGDGVDEALAVMWAGNGSAIRCRDGVDGSHVWQSSTIGSYGMAAEELEDVTGDGLNEVIVASWENAVSVLSGADGSEVWKTNVGTLNGGDVWTAKAIADLDGDGFEDVIAGSFDYHVYAMNGVDGEILWSYNTGNRVFSVAPTGDLNGDDRPDVVAGTQDTNTTTLVYVLSGAPTLIFGDGFESGDVSAWSSTIP